jgi:hypothetical protein
MAGWVDQLSVDPLSLLSGSESEALRYLVRRDLLDQEPGPIEALWKLPEPEKALTKQQPDGSWKYPPRKDARRDENYDLLQTYRELGVLVEQYGFDRRHPAIERAAEYLFSFQTAEGDIRGMFGSQYAPHYTAGMMELLIKAGYGDDPRIDRGFDWYLATRQDDGGWAWPLRTVMVSYYDAIERPDPVKTVRSKPFAHALTGFVLRAFAAHPDHRASAAARDAGALMKSRFFKPDKYSDRRGVEYWTKFQFPFWWANLLTALDSLFWLGFSAADEDIQRGLDWFRTNQETSGLWPTGYGKGGKAGTAEQWVGLAICRVLKRYYS